MVAGTGFIAVFQHRLVSGLIAALEPREVLQAIFSSFATSPEASLAP
jgi:hypothetical protein